MFLKFIIHNRESRVSSFLLEHMDVDAVEDQLDSFFSSSPGDQENYSHRAVLYLVKPSDAMTEDNLMEELHNPENTSLMKTWFIDSITSFETALVEFLEAHDVHDLISED